MMFDGGKRDQLRPSRRVVLTTGGSLAASTQLPGGADAQGVNGFETERALLSSLLTNPEWKLAASDGSESARMLYAAVGTHERYYKGAQGAPRLRAGMERLLDNQGAHLRMVMETAKKYGVPKEMVFLALAESHWNPFGENSARAAGYWQFIPGTAKMLGLQNVPVGKDRTQQRYTREQLVALKDERLDAEKSTDAAMRYLASLKRFFTRIAERNTFTVSEQDAWTFAMWAYNRGPGHVRQTFLTTKGNPLLYAGALTNQAVPSRANAEIVRRSRAESINYVPKILAIWKVVAESLISGALPKKDTVPAPSLPKAAPVPPPAPVEREIAPEPAPKEDGEEAEQVELIEYRVQGGDNLTKIATWISPDPDFVQFRMEQIREYNERTQNRKLKDQLNRGERLSIPAQRLPVASGDTLEKFARIYCSGWNMSVAVNHLRFLNGLRPGMQLRAGKEIIVPLQNN